MPIGMSTKRKLFPTGEMDYGLPNHHDISRMENHHPEENGVECTWN
jgi:hypothetical protein